jgi:hypothetical protein
MPSRLLRIDGMAFLLAVMPPLRQTGDVQA